MKTIIIDTSTEKSVVIYETESGELVKKTLPSGFQSSRHLIEALNIDFKSVEVIGVTIGPGLMTGIRVGMAAAQGLALGLGVPLFGISTFEGYLSKDHVAVIDAKLRGAFIQEFGQKMRLVSLEELAQFPKIVGPNLAHIKHPNKHECEPDPKKMLEAVRRKKAANQFSLVQIYS